MDKIITIKYTLKENQLETISKGLGYSDTITNVDLTPDFFIFLFAHP